MSAECSKCGCDIVYPPGTWPLGECPVCTAKEALAVEKAAHNLTRTALADGAEVVNRAVRTISNSFGATTAVRELDQWAQEAQRVLGLAVAEADKPHHRNEL